MSLPYDMSNLRNYSLAVTGDMFRWIVDFGDESVLQRVKRVAPEESQVAESLIDACCHSGFRTNVTG